MDRRDRNKSPRPTGSTETSYRACGCAHRFVPGEQTSPGRSQIFWVILGAWLVIFLKIWILIGKNSWKYQLRT